MIAGGIGKMRHWLQVEENQAPLEPNRNRNAYNEEPAKWVRVADRWGAVEPLTANEALVAEQMQGFRNLKVRMRFFPGLEAKRHRLKFGQRLLNIEEVLNVDELNEQQLLRVSEKV